MDNKKIHMVTFLLLVIGGLNWGLMGAFNWGVGDVLGDAASKVLYILIGLSAIYELATHKKCCKACAPSGEAPAAPPSD